MKISTALKKVLSQWGLGIYRVAKESGITVSQLSKLVNEDSKDAKLASVKAIADGLEKIDPTLKPYFYMLLERDFHLPDLEMSGYLEPQEKPENIYKILDVCCDIELIDRKLLEEKRLEMEERMRELKPNALEAWISIKMQLKRQQNPNGK